MTMWQLTSDPAWVLRQVGFDPSREREMESLFSIGNGYVGVRGATDFLIPSSQGDLFISGVFDRKAKSNPYSEPEFITTEERENRYSEIVPFPFPFRVGVFLDGEPLKLLGLALVNHARILDFKQGLYFEHYAFKDAKNRTLHIQSFRCASLADPHILLQQIEIFSENYAGPVSIEISMRPEELELAYPHIERHDNLNSEKLRAVTELAVYKTKASHIFSCFASRVSIDRIEKEEMFHLIAIAPGKRIQIRKIVSVFSAEDHNLDQLITQCITHVGANVWGQFDISLADHIGEWQEFWENTDVRLHDVPEISHALRFNLYHLKIAAPQKTKEARSSIGARGLTGRAYEGHVFWDTTIFLFPFYLFSEPDTARQLLLYRYYTLSGARNRARQMGYTGACYSWESTLSGDDVTPHTILIKGTNERIPIFTGTQQIHVTADVAYSIWRYWEATLDEEFLSRFGTEILIETARFWASRVELEGGVYHIRKVVGPDEYHSNVNDNAYTNWMARFNLEKAAWVVVWMLARYSQHARFLFEKLKFTYPVESDHWKEIASKMAMPKVTEDGVIEQFDGFFDLKEVEIPKDQRFKAPISRLFEWDKINQLKLLKQADVLMIPFLFPDAFSKEKLSANYRYYEPRTDHGSSLSVSVHAAIAAAIGEWDDAQEYWEKSLNFDLKNLMHNTPLGIHVGCMGGTWQALIFHMLKVRPASNGLKLLPDPYLPIGCTGADFKLRYHGKSYVMKVHPQLMQKKVAL